MATIRPFSGIRYNQEAVGDLSLVVAPPYDVIDERSRDVYYNRHPYNVIRLILNRPLKSDTDPDQPYRRAAKFVEQWLARRVLIRDPEPSLYLYRQRYIIGGSYKECTGIIAKVKVEDLSDGAIRPHEETMPKPFEDRMKLLEYTMMNFDLVQALYSDPGESLRDPICAEMERFPLIQFQTPDGIWHDIWAVSEGRFVRKVSGFLKSRTLYIADGHHRYQTALEFKKRLCESGELGDDDPRGYLLMMIVEMENPGLSVLPVHRVVVGKTDVSYEDFLKSAGKWFDLVGLDVPAGSRSGQVYSLLKELEGYSDSGCAFGIFVREPGCFMLAVLKDEVDLKKEIEGEYSIEYKSLDVTVLHKLLIEKVLGIPGGKDSVERNLRFTRDPMEAVGMVDSNMGKYAFFVNPTKVSQVKSIADRGEKMPQKSTYFYPKPCSGVVMSRITEW